MSQKRENPEQLIRQAKGDDLAALDRLLGLYRNYLALVARHQIDTCLKVRLDPSDIVQETLLEACQGFARFEGNSEAELIRWLRKILVRNLTDQLRHHQAQKRDVRRDESMSLVLDQNNDQFDRSLATFATPSGQFAGRQRAVVLADALAQLPPDYREVIVRRHIERVPFAEIAEQMGRSSGAVRMLWVRALERLKTLLEESA